MKRSEGMKLSEGKKGRVYEVECLETAPPVTRRLEALGLTHQTRITILNRRKKGSMIIRVRGTRLAVGGRIAQGIQVKEAVI